MAEAMTVDKLAAEVARNVAHLRAELAQMDQPDAEPPDSGLSLASYEAMDASILDEGTLELVAAFYRSLIVVIDGHPGFLDAHPDEIDRSYRIVVEAAIQLGDQLMERLGDQASDAA